ncbi:MAG: hypothetical protein C0501_25155 [Isosphaera sp.]|nr:hypothetical protein [Isosphaera sp.]
MTNRPTPAAFAAVVLLGIAPVAGGQVQSHHQAAPAALVGVPVTVLQAPVAGQYVGVVQGCRPLLPTASAPAPGRAVTGPAVRAAQPAPDGGRGQRDCCKRKDPSCCPQRYCCTVK